MSIECRSRTCSAAVRDLRTTARVHRLLDGPAVSRHEVGKPAR
jgi:hypothetical protein